MVASAIRTKENGWSDPHRPLVMLFLGSSGVGKTELTKQLALYTQRKHDTTLSDDVTIADAETECDFVRLDMSEYQHSYALESLTGKISTPTAEMSLIRPRSCLCKICIGFSIFPALQRLTCHLGL